ncbi:MAG: hypothetical protein A3F11_03175 [Gammaproteobacteria bacterium RIFCSPHIGHO2_12_FULL_37_14]|nr:MAG: hypothetical protein A3F11_03175 [Gammaproteobacteria bacterium RIFCSPHIGHO2_12_FULL_37_14]
MDKISIFILGSGGHAKVLLDCLSRNDSVAVLGFLDNNQQMDGKIISGIPVYGHEEEVLKRYSPLLIQLVNGIGSVGIPTQRKAIFKKFKNAGYRFFNVIHPMAYIGQEVTLGEGVQIMAGSTIQPGCHIGSNVIINTHTAVDHDSYIDDHVHLAPGVICCGDVKIGEGTHIGSGAIIIQGIEIKEHCLVGAGAVVVRNIIMGSKVSGIPARVTE